MRNWIIGIAVALGVYGVNTAMRADRDSSGAIVNEGTIDAFHMRVGDCFNDEGVFDGNAEVRDVPGVPCSTPHDNEVYAIFDLNTTSFPGEAEIGELALNACKERFDSFVGKDYDSSSLDIATLQPTRESWNKQNDREVVCAVYDMGATKLVGTVQGRRL